MNNPSCRLFKYVAHTYGNIGKVRGGAVSTMRHVSFACHGRQYERVKRVTGNPTLEGRISVWRSHEAVTMSREWGNGAHTFLRNAPQ